MLSRFATSLNHLEPGGSGNADRGVRALAVGLDVYEEHSDARALPGFIISAGADRKIRFWNCVKVESSMVVSGFDTEEAKPAFTSSHPTAILTLNTERILEPLAEVRSTAGTKGSGASSSAPAPKKTKASGKTPRSTVISMQQQQLMKAHLDSILDVSSIHRISPKAISQS
jgi:phosphoinositide-3-kinase regulatory subunit 4